MAQVAINAGNTAIAVAAATVAEIGDAEVGIQNAFAIGHIPQCTAVTTLATVTAQIIRVDTGAVIGSATGTNGAASTQPVGPLVVFAPVPAGVAGAIALQVLGSAAAGNAVGTAAAPCVLVSLP